MKWKFRLCCLLIAVVFYLPTQWLADLFHNPALLSWSGLLVAVFALPAGVASMAFLASFESLLGWVFLGGAGILLSALFGGDKASDRAFMGAAALLGAMLPQWFEMVAGADDKGKKAERKVHRALRRVARKTGGKLFFNVLLQDERHSTEIDHVLIAPGGAFVLETKGGYGTLYGGADAPRWRQVMNASLTHDIRNPLLQNKGHVTALRHLPGMPDVRFEPVVVYTEAQFGEAMPRNVVQLPQLEGLLRGYPRRLTDVEVTRAAEAIEAGRVKGFFRLWLARMEHVRRLKEKHGK